jgi:uncharacterized membrane protein
MSWQGILESGLYPELIVFIISMLPVVELRGAIPIALFTFHLFWPIAFLISFIGNLVPVPFIFFLLDSVVKFLNRWQIFERFFNRIFAHVRKRGEMIERYEKLGLILLVAIPLPGTGAWTGSLAAFLLGWKFKKAFPLIVVGVFIAGVIVTALCLLGIWAVG